MAGNVLRVHYNEGFRLNIITMEQERNSSDTVPLTSNDLRLCTHITKYPNYTLHYDKLGHPSFTTLSISPSHQKSSTRFNALLSIRSRPWSTTPEQLWNWTDAQRNSVTANLSFRYGPGEVTPVAFCVIGRASYILSIDCEQLLVCDVILFQSFPYPVCDFLLGLPPELWWRFLITSWRFLRWRCCVCKVGVVGCTMRRQNNWKVVIQKRIWNETKRPCCWWWLSVGNKVFWKFYDRRRRLWHFKNGYYRSLGWRRPLSV